MISEGELVGSGQPHPYKFAATKSFSIGIDSRRGRYGVTDRGFGSARENIP